MTTQEHPFSPGRPLETVFKAHLDNTYECGQVLERLFLNLQDPAALIAEVKRLEENGDHLTAEAHDTLDSLPYSESVQIIQQLVKHLDDIVDGMNNVARIVDILTPTFPQDAARQLLSVIMAMIEKLQAEIGRYPHNELASVRECRAALKAFEERADLIYHQWRKMHRRNGTVSLIAEMDWTEILGILEQTTDSCYHAILSLERITKYRLRESAQSPHP
jgi:uncharacterized protein Yka (UPF0111/DUF47 family)